MTSPLSISSNATLSPHNIGMLQSPDSYSGTPSPLNTEILEPRDCSLSGENTNDLNSSTEDLNDSNSLTIEERLINGHRKHLAAVE